MNPNELLNRICDAKEEIKAFKFEEAIERFRKINSIDNTVVVKEAKIFDLGNEPIMIVPISDIHMGHNQCNIDKLLGVLQFIFETPNCYTVLLGDQTETATKTSVGLSIYEEVAHLPEQLAFLTNILRPLADEGKILGVLTGNHEMRIANFCKLNPAKMLAEQLGIYYLGHQGYLGLKVGDQKYDMVVFHGSSGGSSAAGKISSMRKMLGVTEADIYLSGHTHGKGYDNDIIYRIDYNTSTVVPRMRHFMVCGSYLEYWDNYPEMKGLPPSMTGSNMIILDPIEKDVRVVL